MIDKENVLKTIVANQKRLQKEVDKHNYEFNDLRDMVMSYMTAIVGETDEVNREVNYKWWKNPEEINHENLNEELADIFIFWLDLCIRMGIDEEIFKVIQDKQGINIKRQMGLIEGKEDYKPQWSITHHLESNDS